MKKNLTGIITFLLIFGCSSMAQAYWYAFDVESGGIALGVDAESSVLSLATTDDLIVAFEFDAPPEDSLMEYTFSIDMTVSLYGFISYDLIMDNVALGAFQGIDPSNWMGDGTHAMNYADTSLVSGQFGNYSLVDATLDYDVTFTPLAGESNTFAISIDTLILNGGNTQALLSGIINDLNESGQAPFTLTPPIDLPASVSGTVELTASAVPVPAAFWLLGSGLIGLVGMRSGTSRQSRTTR